MNKTLEDYRKEIDAIDEELINILKKRFAAVREIGKLKKEQHKQPLDEKRWHEVLTKITKNTKEKNISQELIETIYEAIHKAALEIEK